MVNFIIHLEVEIQSRSFVKMFYHTLEIHTLKIFARNYVTTLTDVPLGQPQPQKPGVFGRDKWIG